MSNQDDMGTFHDCEVNFQTEYHEARKFMGLKTTDMDELFSKVTLLYLNAPPKWHTPYLNLIYEIEDRQLLLARLTA